MKHKTLVANPCEIYNQSYFEGARQLSHSRIEKTVALLGDVSGKTILDLGCGTGEASSLLSELRAEVICADVAKYAILACHRKAINGVQTIAQKLPFRTDSFDGVLFMDVIEHIPRGLVPQVLSEIKRVVRPSGKVAIHTMPSFFLEKISAIYGLLCRTHWRRWGVQGGHINTYTPWRLGSELKSAGLEILIFRIGKYPSRAPFAKVLLPLSRILRTLLGNDFWVCCTGGQSVGSCS